MLKHYFQRRPDIDMLEYFCNDNPRRGDDTVETMMTTRATSLFAVLLAARRPDRRRASLVRGVRPHEASSR